LTPVEIESIEIARRRDPDLREDLDLFAAQLSPAASSAFWRVFASEAEGSARPASAVLPALVAAARQVDAGGAPQDPPSQSS